MHENEDPRKTSNEDLLAELKNVMFPLRRNAHLLQVFYMRHDTVTEIESHFAVLRTSSQPSHLSHQILRQLGYFKHQFAFRL